MKKCRSGTCWQLVHNETSLFWHQLTSSCTFFYMLCLKVYVMLSFYYVMLSFLQSLMFHTLWVCKLSLMLGEALLKPKQCFHKREVCNIKYQTYALLMASEASFLVHSIARIFAGRTSCCKCSKCFYVYLNISSM